MRPINLFLKDFATIEFIEYLLRARREDSGGLLMFGSTQLKNRRKP